MDRKDLKTPNTVTATSKLSKKQKIIEIDLRSQKLGSPKRYHSQGESPQSSDFGTIEPQITTHVHSYLDAQTEFDRYVAHLRYVCFETFLLRAFLHRQNIILALRKYFGEQLIGR